MSMARKSRENRDHKVSFAVVAVDSVADKTPKVAEPSL